MYPASQPPSELTVLVADNKNIQLWLLSYSIIYLLLMVWTYSIISLLLTVWTNKSIKYQKNDAQYYSQGDFVYTRQHTYASRCFSKGNPFFNFRDIELIEALATV